MFGAFRRAFQRMESFEPQAAETAGVTNTDAIQDLIASAMRSFRF
jgi:hypothetical protein